MPSAGSVEAARPDNHRAGGGSSPTAALHDIIVRPIPQRVAKPIVEREHYLHSIPGGTHMAFGVFLELRLLGVVTIGAGPMNAYSLVAGAIPEDCLSPTRLWLSDVLPRRSESRVLGIVLRAPKRHPDLKFLLADADPQQGHAGPR